MASNPMQQFTVHRIGPEIKIAGIDLSFTNASLFMIISALAIILFLFYGSKEKRIIPNKIQLISEMFYTFVAKMISDTAGSKAKPYFPFIFSLLCLFYFVTWWECFHIHFSYYHNSYTHYGFTYICSRYNNRFYQTRV